MAWDDEKRVKVVEMYEEANPTPKTSSEIIKGIAEEVGETHNGVRMILSKAGVYVKVEETSSKKPSEKTTSTRVSKADSISKLIEAINEVGVTVDNEIIDKLTGKQAIYFTSVILAAK